MGSQTFSSQTAQAFRSEYGQEFSKQYDIKIHHTSAYHPQTNANVERANRDLGNYLRLYVEQKSKWCDYIPGFVYCHNITRDGEKYSPAYLLFLQELNNPTEAIGKNTILGDKEEMVAHDLESK